MNRPSALAVLGLAALFLVGLLAVGLTATDAEAARVCWCSPEVGTATPIFQGVAATCSAAYNSARDQAIASGRQRCTNNGFWIYICLEDFIVTTPCALSGGEWTLSGYGVYKCKNCLPV